MDTIFALASARGKAGVSVVRVSGSQAQVAAAVLCGRLPAAREVGLRRLSWAGEVLDEALVLVFDKPASFTGEDVVEFHIHGSVATVSALLRALAMQPGLRAAEAGEFTRRSLDNGKLDLVQVEGLADLIDAETEVQRKQALKVLSGALGQKADTWRSDLIRVGALLEATIDFADEDVPQDVTPEVLLLIEKVSADLQAQLAGAGAAERIRDGFEVAIVGRPNAGKSTLLNALAGRDAAITSAVAGTTRDIIEVRMEIAGLAVTLLDTAGLRESDDEIEILGVERALARARSADLRIFLLDEAGGVDQITPDSDDIIVSGKADLTGFGISGKTGEGLAELLLTLGQRLEHRVASASSVIRERHRRAMEDAVGALESARSEVMTVAGRSELAAADVRRATRRLDALVGRVDVEDLLGEIFSSFCIGK